MSEFKILFPSGYKITDLDNDNIDINVILPDEKVFFGTIFTTQNITNLLSNNEESYFWSINMFITKDLSIDTITCAIDNIIRDGVLSLILSEIGTTESVYENSILYSSLEKWQ